MCIILQRMQSFRKQVMLMLNVSILTDDIIARMIEINDDDDFDLRTSCDRL